MSICSLAVFGWIGLAFSGFTSIFLGQIGDPVGGILFGLLPAILFLIMAGLLTWDYSKRGCHFIRTSIGAGLAGGTLTYAIFVYFCGGFGGMFGS